jgi:hypothetical protein
MLWQLENTPQDMDDPQPVYLSMRCIRCRGENHINLQEVEVYKHIFFNRKYGNLLPTSQMQYED